MAPEPSRLETRHWGGAVAMNGTVFPDLGGGTFYLELGILYSSWGQNLNPSNKAFDTWRAVGLSHPPPEKKGAEYKDHWTGGTTEIECRPRQIEPTGG